MNSQQTKEQEKPDNKDSYTSRFSEVVRNGEARDYLLEAMRQATEDQRKVLDKWTANAQDPNKIYWKG